MFLELIKKVIHEEVPSVIESYLILEDCIDVEQSKILKNLFDKMDQFELKSINVIQKGFIEDGLAISLNKKQNQFLLKDPEIIQMIDVIIKNTNVEANDIRKAYYIKSLTTLIQKVNYLTNEEQVLLNFLFNDIKLGSKVIEEVENEDQKYVIR